jgi:hypothetical protein
MPLNQLAQTTILRGIQSARKVLEELKPVIDGINIVYDSQGGLKDTITQQDLDDLSSLSGLTKAQLDDAMYVLTAVLRSDIANSYSQLAHLAARGVS